MLRRISTFHNICCHNNHFTNNNVNTNKQRRRQFFRFFSGSSNNTKNTKWKNPNYRLLARAVTFLRIPFLAVAVYGLGYQKGIIDYAQNPIEKDKELLSGMLQNMGTVDIVHPKNFSNEYNRRVQRVGRRIIGVAQKYVKEELKSAQSRVLSSLSNSEVKDIDVDKLSKLYQRNDEVLFWSEANQRLMKKSNGEDGEWKILLLECPVPNAFVSEMFPNRIFVTTSMLEKYVENDDELGLIFGHEISHLIHGHNTQSNASSLILRSIEMTIIALDPFDGLASIALISAVAAITKLLSASESRESEHEADKMGIKIAAMACYDTKKGSLVFKKMYESKLVENQGLGSLGREDGLLHQFLSTHPPSEERFKYLSETSTHENASKYKDQASCNQWTKAWHELTANYTAR